MSEEILKKQTVVTPLDKEQQKIFPDVKGYDEDGKPVFKKKISDVTILTKRQTKADKIMFTTVFIIFLIQSITLLMPIILMFLLATQNPKETDLFGWLTPDGTPLYAKGFYIRNFIDTFFGKYKDGSLLFAYNGKSFLLMTWNSIWITVVQTGLSVFMPTMTGYVMSKYKFVGRDFIYGAVIFSMVIPVVGSTAAGLQLHAQIGTWDTPIFAVLNSIGGFGTTFIVYYGFFKSVSWAYAEATQIDGGGPFTIFFRVMLPQAKPIMMTYMITNGIANWNAYEQLLLYMPSYPNIAAGLLMLKGKVSRFGEPIYYAGLMIAMIPAIALFATFSNKIMGSISIGGLKG